MCLTRSRGWGGERSWGAGGGGAKIDVKTFVERKIRSLLTSTYSHEESVSFFFGRAAKDRPTLHEISLNA